MLIWMFIAILFYLHSLSVVTIAVTVDTFISQIRLTGKANFAN